MGVPDFQSIMLPLLKFSSDKKTIQVENLLNILLKSLI